MSANPRRAETIDEPAVPNPGLHAFDTSTHENFYEYYRRQSLSPATLQRFKGIADAVMRAYGPVEPGQRLDVLDVGCGAGAQSQIWVEKGHAYTGVDINAPLIDLAKERATETGSDARFEVSSATQLPHADSSFDICLLPELLEHIADWQSCLNEAVRVLRPGGVIYISTSNCLCPKQQEFNLPAYSWYPGFAKRYFERRAVTDWPAVANHARYPAVHWFSYYQLRRFFADRGLESLDRFDMMRLDDKTPLQRKVVAGLKASSLLRFAGQMLTPATLIIAKR